MIVLAYCCPAKTQAGESTNLTRTVHESAIAISKINMEQDSNSGYSH